MQQNESNLIKAAPVSPPALIAATPVSTAPTQTKPIPEKIDESIGIHGYLRMLRILISFALFGVRAFINSRDWRGRKREKTSEQRHEEGAALREKFLRLGPTFIKTGQTLASRADLLPFEYIEELSSLQDEVPPFPAE